jgi:uncharacterized membrane protein
MNGQGLQPYTFPGDGFRGGVIDLAGNGDGGNHGLLWVIFTLLLIVLVVTLVSLFLDEYRRAKAAEGGNDARPVAEHEASTQGGDVEPPAVPGDALAILDTRYAAGEVTRRDYLRIRKDIVGPETAPS